MASAWPILQARLMTLLPTLPVFSGVPVYDGPPASSEETVSYVTIGFAENAGDAGTYSPARAAGDSYTEETGQIVSEIVSGNGDSDLAAARTLAFGLADAWQAQVEADKRLGVLAEGSSCSLDVAVVPVQYTSGVEQRLVVTLHYFALT